MAPEVIEMSGVTSKCDIWSVGCVVLEMLTGAPPYFNMPPFSALFKIVTDDCPTFPKHISPDCKDFLAKCFIKVI